MRRETLRSPPLLRVISCKFWDGLRKYPSSCFPLLSFLSSRTSGLFLRILRLIAWHIEFGHRCQKILFNEPRGVLVLDDIQPYFLQVTPPTALLVPLSKHQVHPLRESVATSYLFSVATDSNIECTRLRTAPWGSLFNFRLQSTVRAPWGN